MIPDSTLLEYWREERTFPDWFKRSNDVWQQTEEEFLEFCHKCWDIFEIEGKCLVYVEDANNAANLHISFRRGLDIDEIMPDLLKLRTQILLQFPMIVGWVHSRNSGLKETVRKLGMEFRGVTMIHGESHGKVIEWQAFSAVASDFVLARFAKTC